MTDVYTCSYQVNIFELLGICKIILKRSLVQCNVYSLKLSSTYTVSGTCTFVVHHIDLYYPLNNTIDLYYPLNKTKINFIHTQKKIVFIFFGRSDVFMPPRLRAY